MPFNVKGIGILCGGEQVMYMDKRLGLVVQDQGNQYIHIPWSQVRCVTEHINEGKGWDTCPIKLEREAFAYILQWELDSQQAKYEL